uniref:phospholipase A2 inhibitor and Ly6/PLAUR domain-containing protein-like n=1 Tax=Semicossyphus pulcher TaxID=241346 RepID=UPI0037E8B4CA
MRLLLTVCLTCTLLITAESLLCHMCANANCSSSTSVTCPLFSVCKTITSLRQTMSSTSVTVNKNCSSLRSCFTLFNARTEWAVNTGFAREAHAQICCITDNCNFRTLAITNSSANGKQCPACASPAESVSGTCNSTLSCEGVEDSCFNGTSTLNSTQLQHLGCMSRNLCGLLSLAGGLLGENARITCGAPGGSGMGAVLLTFAVTAHQVLL